MKKIINYFGLPIFALVIILILYFALTIRNLQNQNQKLVASVDKITEQLNQTSDNLTQQLAQEQNQINDLQSTDSKKVSSGSVVKYTPIVQTVTQQVTKEIEKNQATVTIQNIGSFKMDLQSNDTAFSVTKRAAEQNGFALNFTMYSFGAFINSIGTITPTGNQYWAFYFNGNFSNIGASDQKVSNGDNIFWQLATF